MRCTAMCWACRSKLACTELAWTERSRSVEVPLTSSWKSRLGVSVIFNLRDLRYATMC